MMNLNQLTTFVTVISEGSMTAAADKLFLTQPAVSQQIRNLEEDLGVHLLVRGVRLIKATPQGEILFEQAKKIIQLAQSLEFTVKSIGSNIEGYLRIGTLNSVGLHLITPVMNRFLRHYPKLRTKIEYDRGENLIRSFLKDELDIIIIPDVMAEFSTKLDGAQKKFVVKEEMWLVSSGKQSEVPPQIEIENLKDRPYISIGNEYPAFSKKFEAALAKSNTELNIIFESENVGTLKRAIESGIGWGFVPAHSIKKQVKAGRLLRIHVSGFTYDVDLNFYYRDHEKTEVLAQNFYQVLTAERF